jgi:hypothetical protein
MEAVLKTVMHLWVPHKARNSSDELGDYVLSKQDCASRSYLELVNIMTELLIYVNI